MSAYDEAYNARWYDPHLGRFTQPDTISFVEALPNPTDAKAFDRYAYVNNNPVRYNDPSGHCGGVYSVGGENEYLSDEEKGCWDYLLNSFCADDICKDNSWTSRMSGVNLFEVDGFSFLAFNSGSEWLKSELEILHKALVAIKNAFSKGSMDWQKTDLWNYKFQRDRKINMTSSPLKIIYLASIDLFSIWHEAGHAVDFGTGGYLQWKYAQQSEATCIFIPNTYRSPTTGCSIYAATPGYYFREYGRNSGTEQGYMYGQIFARADTYADAFALWVDMSNNGVVVSSVITKVTEKTCGTGKSWSPERRCIPTAPNYSAMYELVDSGLKSTYSK